MLLLDSFVKDQSPKLFCPRVTPDPSASERLEAKLHEATQLLRNRFTKNYAQRVLSSYQHSTS